MRPKVCKVCREPFTPVRLIQPTCGSFACGMEYAMQVVAKNKAAKARKEARAHREAKVKAKTRQQWIREAQSAFNKYIRTRDAGQACISCGRHHQGQWHAGHFLSTGARPELRFDERNVHLQCAPCNNHLSGNIVLYRKGLIAKLGQEAVDYLEGPHEPKHYTVDDLKAIKAEYTRKAKELDRAESNH